MTRLIAVCLLSANLIVTAQAVPTPSPTQTVLQNIGGGGAADLLNDTKYNPDGQVSGNNVQVTMGCTDGHGKTLKPQDDGYQDCLRDLQRDLQRKRNQAPVRVEKVPSSTIK